MGDCRPVRGWRRGNQKDNQKNFEKGIKCKYENLEIKGENQQLQAPTKFTEPTQPLGKNVKLVRERAENRRKKLRGQGHHCHV